MVKVKMKRMTEVPSRSQMLLKAVSRKIMIVIIDDDGEDPS